MSHDPFLETYEALKIKIKQYEVQRQLDFDKSLNDLRENHFRSNFQNRYEGNIYQSKNSGPFQVTEYFNYDRIAITFLNTGYQMIARANNINRGEVKDPYAVSIMGIGYIGVGPYKIDTSSFDRMIYSRWRGIIDRCYVLKEGNKSMHPEWFNYQYFAAWFYSEYYLAPYCTMYDMCVDKDIMYPRNEEYSPYKCLIIPSFINSKVQLKDYDRWLMERFDNGMMSQSELMKLYGRKEARETIIRDLGEQYRDYLPPHVYLAIKNYRMF